MTKHYAVQDGKPFILELASTPVMVFDGGEPDVWNLTTLMDLSLGILCDYHFWSSEAANPSGESPYEFVALDDCHYDDEDADITLSIPGRALLSDQIRRRMTIAEHIQVVRRPATSGLHPVHTAAIDLLTWTPDGCPADIEVLLDRWARTVNEVASCSLYEHTFDFVGGVGYGPVATYQQPRKGDVDDYDHASHDFDPWCCGVARLQALQTPRLTPVRRGRAGLDASNGA